MTNHYADPSKVSTRDLVIRALEVAALQHRSGVHRPARDALARLKAEGVWRGEVVGRGSYAIIAHSDAPEEDAPLDLGR